MQELQQQSQAEIERLKSMLATIYAEHAAVVSQLVSAAPAAVPAVVRLSFLPVHFGSLSRRVVATWHTSRAVSAVLTLRYNVRVQVLAEHNRRHTIDADATSLPFSSAPRRLGGSLQGGAVRVPTNDAPQMAWGDGDSNNPGPTCTTKSAHLTVAAAAQEQRTALQREFHAVQRARAVEQASIRARLAELIR